MPGLFLSRHVFQQHQLQAESAQKQRHEPDPLWDTSTEAAVLASTLDRSKDMDVDASVVAGAQDIDSMDTDDAMSDFEDDDRVTVADSSHEESADDEPGDEVDEYVGRRLESLQQEFENRIRHFQMPPVIFDQQPTSSLDAPPLLLNSNKALFTHRERMETMVLELDKLRESCRSERRKLIKSLIITIQKHDQVVDRAISRAWEAHRVTQLYNGLQLPYRRIDCQSITFNLRGVSPITLGIYLIVVVVHILSGLSRGATNFLLEALPLLIELAVTNFISSTHQLSGTQKFTMPPAYSDVRPVLDFLRVDPDIRIYATCPDCCRIYSASTSTQGDLRYPVYCTQVGCQAQLSHNQGKSPIRPYGYQPIASWLSRFVARPEILKELNWRKKWWGDFMKNPTTKCEDVLVAPILQSLRGPDAQLFLQSQSELRLAFGLNIDWFNPRGNKVSGKAVSIGGIYLVCMNLPIHLRYKVENMYLVGIIPGPKEPHLYETNYFLEPLIDDLLSLWTDGILFTSLIDHPLGLLVRCALIAIIADLLAVRKVAGMALVTTHAHLCSRCRQTHQTMDNMDSSTWQCRTASEHREAAGEWLNASTQQERDRLFQENGVYWTPFLRLPYWDPIRMVLVDAMHNLFLNDLKTHCRDYLGMDGEANKPGSLQPHTTQEQINQIAATARATIQGDRIALEGIRLTYLIAMVEENKLLTPKQLKALKKADVVNLLVGWDCSDPDVELQIPTPVGFPTLSLQKPKKPPLLDYKVLSEVWKDMAQTVTPSWLGSPPKNFGVAGQGKLSADQWRTGCLVNLVITLIRLWSNEDWRKYLNNYISLVIAVRWATMRSTSPQQIQIVQDQFISYFNSTIQIFGKSMLRPNSHMSLHLPECLRDFGPVHGWWTFPFERYNGIIQRQNSNNKLGELELTFLRTFCRGAHLKALIGRNDLPLVLNRFIPLLEKYYHDSLGSSLLRDIFFAPSEGESVTYDLRKCQALEEDIYRGLLEYFEHREPGQFVHRRNSTWSSSAGIRHLNHLVQPVDSFDVCGVTFAQAKTSLGDSQVIFRNRTNLKVPGRIREIFTHFQKKSNTESKEYFFAIDPLESFDAIDDDHPDPYLQYPLLETALYHNRYTPKVQVASLKEIVSHFASYPVSGSLVGHNEDLLVVVSLDRDAQAVDVLSTETHASQ